MLAAFSAWRNQSAANLRRKCRANCGWPGTLPPLQFAQQARRNGSRV